MALGPLVYDIGGVQATDADLPWEDVPAYGAEAALFQSGVDPKGRPIMGMPAAPNWMASFVPDPKVKAREMTKNRAAWDAYWKNVEKKQADPKLGSAAKKLLEEKKIRARLMIQKAQEKWKGFKAPADWFAQPSGNYIVGQNGPSLQDSALAAFLSRLA